MPGKHDLSDYCLVNHFAEGVEREPFTPIWLLRIPLGYIDRKFHFTELFGGIWRLLGVNRSPKNPNICNI